MDRIQLTELPDFHQFDNAILGSFSLIAGKGKRAIKYLKTQDCLSYNGVFETPSYHFRQVIKDISFPKRNKYPYPSYPFKAKMCKLPYAYYIDIRKAYWQIASVWGAECFITPEKIACYGQSCFSDELFSLSRVSRGLLVTGLSEKGYYTQWNGSALNGVTFYNGKYAPHLVGAIMCTLHAVMAELNRYTVYCHTDGLIVPEWHLDKTMAILSQWGLSSAIKSEGYTIIRGVGAYQIGSKSTLTFQKRLSVGTQSNIWIESAEWWKRMYIRGVERRVRNNSLFSL